MKKYIFGAIGIVAALASAVGFYSIHHKAPAAPKIIAVIGLTQCGKWMGGIAVDGTGGLHGSIDMTVAQAQTLAKSLPAPNNMIAAAPCGPPPGMGT